MDTLHDGRIILHHGDCLDVMCDIPDQSVDAIICDPPYGTTACKWDVVIPFESMWAALKRIIKPRGAIVLFGSQPFTSALVMSNHQMFRYELMWSKEVASNRYEARLRPMKSHENILIFAYETPVYYPIKEAANPRNMRRRVQKVASDTIYGYMKEWTPSNDESTRYPKSVITINAFSNECHKTKRIHPTQKPLALLEYLIRTYTNEGETVLDFTFGSCTAGVAALNTDRCFIGIERDDTYYNLGLQRVQAAINALPPMPL